VSYFLSWKCGESVALLAGHRFRWRPQPIGLTEQKKPPREGLAAVLFDSHFSGTRFGPG
jgi:hypothetical protein